MPRLRSYSYSDAEAGVRVSSMKLIQELPSAKTALFAGKISLTALSKTSSSIRKQEKLISEALPMAQKEEILVKISGKSTRETELILKETEANNLKDKNIIIPVGDPKQKIMVTTSVVKKICQLKKLKGNFSDSELLELLLDQELKKIAQELPAETPGHQKQKHAQAQAQCLGEKPPTRYIKAAVKRAIRERAQNRCEFVEKQTGRRCSEVHHLEFDHLRPFSAGGASDWANLSLRCRAHNQRSAITFYGLTKMDEFFNRGKGKNAELHDRPAFHCVSGSGKFFILKRPLTRFC